MRHREKWWEKAACKGQAPVFDTHTAPLRSTREETLIAIHEQCLQDNATALKTCRKCPVIRDCFNDARKWETDTDGHPIQSKIHGIYGGETPASRTYLYLNQYHANKRELPVKDSEN